MSKCTKLSNHLKDGEDANKRMMIKLKKGELKLRFTNRIFLD